MGVHMRVDLLSLDRQIEELSSQFAHVSCQSTGEAPPLYPPTQGYIYAAPPPPPPPPNPPSYCQPSPPVRTHLRFTCLIKYMKQSFYGHVRCINYCCFINSALISHLFK